MPWAQPLPAMPVANAHTNNIDPPASSASCGGCVDLYVTCDVA
jgi:hypothetical protein